MKRTDPIQPWRLWQQAAICWLLAASASASVTFQPFHHFFGFTGNIPERFTTEPNPPLIQARDGNLYGTVAVGGTYGYGYIFRSSTNGALNIVYSFTGGSDGGTPESALLQASDGYFYGTTADGGADYAGTVFRFSTNGTLTSLYSFTGGGDGGAPQTALVQAGDGNLYGAASSGGGYDTGTLFRITTGGVLAPLYTNSLSYYDDSPTTSLTLDTDGNLLGTVFSVSDNPGEAFRLTTNGVYTSIYEFTFADGYPTGLVQATDGDLYGDTEGAGGNGGGVVFKLTTNGAFTILYTFGFVVGDSYPGAALIQGSDGNLYGTTSSYYGIGNVFAMTTNGAQTGLHQFSGGNDGAYPSALVQASNGYLLGTTDSGGAGNRGTIFSVDTNGGDGGFTTLNSLPSANTGEYPDGASPDAGLAQGPGGDLYGSTPYGGLENAGVIFHLTTNGSFTVLYSFTNGAGASGPSALTCATDGNLYGTTPVGGGAGKGTIFRITTNGVLTSLYSFVGTNDGAMPLHGLIQATDGNFYGTASAGGISNSGTIFQLTSDGKLAPIYTFTNGDDGFDPVGLIQNGDDYLYGMAYSGGSGSNGTVFRISLAGTLNVLHSFTGGDDGYQPWGPSLLATNGYIYGTTHLGGAAPGQAGTVFRVSTDGLFTTLHSFNGSDGNAATGLAEGSDGNLYGTTESDVFQISTNGVFNIIHTFVGGGSDGGGPLGSLLSASDGNIYGTTQDGGGILGGFGTIFRIALTSSNAPIPAIQTSALSAGNLNFAFPAAAGQSYYIQQTTNLAATNWTFFTNLVGAGSTVQLSVPATNSAQFFRLREP